jgi:RHS repeat-associated protein
LSYERPAGDDRDLIQTATIDFELIQPDGTVYLYGIPTAMQGNSNVPLLLSITDRHGNSLSIEYNAQGAILALRHSALSADPQANPPTDPKWTFVYDANLPVSRVTRIDDPFGRSCHFGYDAEYRLETQTDMGGMHYGYAYTTKVAESVDDLSGVDPLDLVLPVAEELFITAINTPKGSTTIYTEPADGVQDAFLDIYPPSGEPMGRNYRITITDQENYPQEYHFDGASAVTWHRDSVQLERTVEDPYDYKGWRGPYTGYWQSLVEGRGKVNYVFLHSPDDFVSVYDASSHDYLSRQATEFTDATGETTWRSYYSSGASAGRLEWIRLPKSENNANTDHEIRFTYATNGKDLRTITRNLGGVEETLLDITYHSNRSPHIVTDALGRTLTYTWHTNGLPNTVTVGPSSDVITYGYDSNWRPSGTEINNQTVFTTAYDLEGRLRSTLDAAGYFVTLDYDDLNRLTREEHPDNSFIERIWECCHIGEIRSGKITGGGDRILERTVLAHDARGLTTRVTDTAGRVTRFGYDGASRLQTLTDANKNETTWEYDDFGRLSAKIFPDLSEEATYWLNATQIDHIVNRRQQTTWFYYDAHSQIDLIEAPDFTTDYSYDNWDRIEQIDHTPVGQSVQVHEFEHDLLGRIKEIDGPWTDDTISWVYNDALRKVTRTTPGNIVTETVADAFGRIATVTNPLGLFTHNYTGESPKPDSIIHTNGLANGTPYSGFDTLLDWHGDDQRQALETITSNLPGGSVIAKHTYGYDSLGRIDSWKRDAILANPSGVTRSYEWGTRHDFASQLASVAERTLSGTIQGAWDYSYDPAGNIASVQTSTGPANLAFITNRGHNSLNQIDSLGGGGPSIIRGTLDEPGKVSVGVVGQGDKPARMIQDNRFEAELALQEGANSIGVTAIDGSYNRSDYVFEIDVASAASRSFSHDDDGNLLSDGIRSYEWDSQSRLAKITWTTGKTTEFRYNALGQRSERIEKIDGSVSAHHYFLLDGIEPINRYTGGTAAANIDRRYFDQGEQRKIGSNWDNHHYCRDHLVSVREVVNSDGNLLARYDFDPYGKRLTQYEDSAYTGGCDIGYTGHLTLPSPVTGQTEIVLTHFRAYDPELSRWLSPDPIGEEGGINLYQYAASTPLGLIDKDGRLPSVVSHYQHNPIRNNDEWKAAATGWACGAAGGLAIAGVAALPTASVAVGPGAYSASPIHVAWGTGGRWLHATGKIGNQRVRSLGADLFAEGQAWLKIPIKVLSVDRLMRKGQKAKSCVTAAANAIGRSWWPF